MDKAIPVSKFGLLPPELEICLSDRCNMACRYCYFVTQNKGKARCLTLEQLKRAVDLWISYTKPVNLKGLSTELTRVRKIELVGGEPFLNFPLLREITGYIRERAGETMDVSVYTNGSLLTKDRVRYLLDQQINLVISLDGGKETNDLNRKFCGNPGKSVFDTVMAGLDRLPREYIHRMYASVTSTSETIGFLVNDAKFLVGLGFREIFLDLDMLEIWPPEKIGELHRALRGLKDYYVSLLGGRGSPYRSNKIYSFGFNDKLKPRDMSCVTDEITLGPDGGFYPCSIPAVYGAGRSRYRIGDLKSGLDFKKLQKVRDELAEFVAGTDSRRCSQCPVGGYFDCKLKGVSPYPLNASQRRVSRVFSRELGGFIAVNSALNRALKERAFGLFDRQPCHTANKEIRCLTMELNPGVSSGLILKTGRDAADLLLFSPGGEKHLVFYGSNPFAEFDVFESVSVYAMLKAGCLGKRLLVTVECGGAEKISAEQLAFLKTHAIMVGIHAKESPGVYGWKKIGGKLNSRLVKAIIDVDPASVGAMHVRVKEMALLGVENFCFRIGNVSGCPPESLRGLGKEFKKISEYAVKEALKGKFIFIENFSRIFSRRSGAGECPFYESLAVSSGSWFFRHFMRSRLTDTCGKVEAGNAAGGILAGYRDCVYAADSASCRECMRKTYSVSGLRELPGASGVFEESSAQAARSILSESRRDYVRQSIVREKMFSGLFRGADAGKDPLSGKRI